MGCIRHLLVVFIFNLLLYVSITAIPSNEDILLHTLVSKFSDSIVLLGSSLSSVPIFDVMPGRLQLSSFRATKEKSCNPQSIVSLLSIPLSVCVINRFGSLFSADSSPFLILNAMASPTNKGIALQAVGYSNSDCTNYLSSNLYSISPSCDETKLLQINILSGLTPRQHPYGVIRR